MKSLNNCHLGIYIALCIVALEKRIRFVQSLSSAPKEGLTTRRQWGDRILPSVTTVLVAPALVGSAPKSATAMEVASTRLERPHVTEEYFLPGTTAPQAGRFFFPTLTPPFQNRATYRYALGRQAWAFEQCSCDTETLKVLQKATQ